MSGTGVEQGRLDVVEDGLGVVRKDVHDIQLSMGRLNNNYDHLERSVGGIASDVQTLVRKAAGDVPWGDRLKTMTSTIVIGGALIAIANWWFESGVRPYKTDLERSVKLLSSADDKLDETNRRQWTYAEETRKRMEENRNLLAARKNEIMKNTKFREAFEARARERMWQAVVSEN